MVINSKVKEKRKLPEGLFKLNTFAGKCEEVYGTAL